MIGRSHTGCADEEVDAGHGASRPVAANEAQAADE